MPSSTPHRWLRKSGSSGSSGSSASTPHRWLRNHSCIVVTCFVASTPHRWLRNQKLKEQLIYPTSTPHRWLRNTTIWCPSQTYSSTPHRWLMSAVKKLHVNFRQRKDNSLNRIIRSSNSKPSLVSENHRFSLASGWGFPKSSENPCLTHRIGDLEND